MEKEKTGVELITEERQEQIDKYGWTSEHDDTHYGLLKDAAKWVLDGDAWYPFDDEGEEGGFYEKISHNRNDEIECLKIAGALIAAEIDRLQRKSKK